MSERRFGHIPGYPIGSHFVSRQALSRAGVHRPRIAGICRQRAGRAPIRWFWLAAMKMGRDYEHTIFYTGHGGRDPQTREQIGHQVLIRGNLALAQNRLHGLPVRVIRGAGFRSPYAPGSGYRYDGLYTVDDYWRGVGRAGFFIWRFRLVKMDEDLQRQERVVQERLHAQELKQLYHYRCQICRVQLRGTAGSYAEAVHIRPLEAPHNGPDTSENMLCLCPNCHILLSIGGVGIADDFTLIGRPGSLYVDFRHRINIEHVRYRRQHYPPDSEM